MVNHPVIGRGGGVWNEKKIGVKNSSRNFDQSNWWNGVVIYQDIGLAAYVSSRFGKDNL